MADVKAPTNKFKGEGPILILGLLKDDDQKDLEMKRMTDLLESRVKSAGRKSARIDESKSLNQCKLGGARTLYITGHSRFKDESTKIRPVPDRTLGGFTIDEVVAALFQGICAGVTEIEFWCCESACKRGTGNLKSDAGGTCGQRFDLQASKALKHQTAAQNWSEISTLDVICEKLTKLAYETSQKTNRPFGSFPTVRITGLNGVGYITEDDTYITTFPQDLGLAELNTVLKLEKDMREGRAGKHTKKNLEQADGRLRGHIASQSCHFITQELDFSALNAEACAEYKAITKIMKNQSERDDAPQKLAPGRIQQMQDALRPLMEKKVAETKQQGT
jgi:hypothetical protein